MFQSIFNILYWLLYYSCPNFPLLSPSDRYPHFLQQCSLSSCPWVMPVSSLASPFPILFLAYPCLFSLHLKNNFLYGNKILINENLFPKNLSSRHCVQWKYISYFFDIYTNKSCIIKNRKSFRTYVN